MGQLVFTSRIANIVKDKNGLKKDNDGYYYVRLGTIGVPNSAGIVYLFTKELKELFEDSSPFMLRILNGYLRSEYGHPQQEVGQSNEAYFARLTRLEPKLQCGHFKSIEVKEGEEGPGTATVYGWFLPNGPYGNFVKEELDNPNINSAFSIRTLAKQFMQNGRLVRQILTLVTWDYVTTPGISTANKIGALEEDLFILDTDNLNNVEALICELESKKHNDLVCGNEHDSELTSIVINELKKCKGDQCLMKYWSDIV